MNDDLIEKAAKAIAQEGRPAWRWEEADEWEHDLARNEARAALAVFEEAHAPTDDERLMQAPAIRAVRDVLDYYADEIDVHIWQEIASVVNDIPDCESATAMPHDEHAEPQGAPTDAAEVGARALEDAADAINRDFQSLPSWGESYRAGERTQDWMSGGTRMVIDTIDWLRARASVLRAVAETTKRENGSAER